MGEACDGADAVQHAVNLRPDIAILDFSMPGMNGPAAALQIARSVPETSVVILTVHDSEQILQQVLEAGVRGLVLKSDADRTLLDAVDAVSKGRTFFSAQMSELLHKPSFTLRLKPLPLGQFRAVHLTVREREVMGLLAEGLTSRAAAMRLHISTRTVETHRVNINRKLGLNSIADLVRYAMRNGITAHG